MDATCMNCAGFPAEKNIVKHTAIINRSILIAFFIGITLTYK